jgi:hypothetical protein
MAVSHVVTDLTPILHVMLGKLFNRLVSLFRLFLSLRRIGRRKAAGFRRNSPFSRFPGIAAEAPSYKVLYGSAQTQFLWEGL